jgi:SAM-dependent methyltransferase
MLIDTLTPSEIAPCLAEGPLAERGSELVKAANELGNRPYASVLRAWCVPALFTSMERLLANGDDPIEGVNIALRDLTQFLMRANESGLDRIESNGPPSALNGNDPRLEDVKDVTGNHYGNLFKEFSSPSFWDEPVRLLEQRLVRNGISAADVREKSVLDSGCGGGRYSAAWRLLGAKPVVGVDISPINIDDATRRAELAKLEGISFKQGNVLDLPFAEAEFDIVFSNGVLHHTTDWKRGIAELLRVLKHGGWGWLYLIENPGGVFWDVIEILRVMMKDEDKTRSRAALQLIDMPANRIFYMLDHVMVPINLRLSPGEIEDCLHSCGAKDIRRLDRGADIDRIEHIASGEKYAADRFGVGENRYVFSKP